MQAELDEIKKDNHATDPEKCKMTQQMLTDVVDKSFRDVDSEFIDEASENMDMDGTTANVGIFWEDKYSESFVAGYGRVWYMP